MILKCEESYYNYNCLIGVLKNKPENNHLTFIFPSEIGRIIRKYTGATEMNNVLTSIKDNQQQNSTVEI